MANDDDFKPATGRFKRLAKLASLSARLSTEAVARGVQRFKGKEEDTSVSMLGISGAEKLVATLGELKGLAMKIGQSIAMDPDLLTPEIRAVVAKLQNQAPPMPYATVAQVVQDTLGQPPEKLYQHFDKQPLGSASLGQVHRAVTLQGEAVVVKVQYPGIAKALESDLSNLGTMVNVLATSTRMLQGKAYFEELREGLLHELDYRIEGERAERYRQAMKTLPHLTVPRVFESLTGEKVLTLEFFEGPTLKTFLAELSQHDNAKRFTVASQLVEAMWGPFLLEGVVHADPHPGNFILRPNGTLGVLDFGAIKQLSDPWLFSNRKLFRHLLFGEPYLAIEDSMQAGMVYDNATTALPFIEKVIETATRAVRSDDFDYGKSAINRDMRNLFLSHSLLLKEVKPPKEAVQFFRAVAGMSQNLENLQVRGNFQAVYQRLYEFSVEHGRAVESRVR
jgi:predicted unusual protein kinase regulating ubiquinone biosynthesis (AarF/ABC1/UbiB family)